MLTSEQRSAEARIARGALAAMLTIISGGAALLSLFSRDYGAAALLIIFSLVCAAMAKG